MKRPRTRYAKAGDIHIAYQAFGDGPIDLLWAQGWATQIEYAWESPDYARFLNKLARFARVIFFDKRGVGMSDRDVGKASCPCAAMSPDWVYKVASAYTWGNAKSVARI